MPKTEDGHTDAFYSRVDAVVEVMLKNERYLQAKRMTELVEQIKKQFNIETRWAYEYISEAKREIRKLGKERKDRAFKKAMRDREFIVLAAKRTDDLKLALDAMKDRDKLSGLYVDEVKQSGEMTVKSVDMSMFTEFGLDRLKRGDKLEDVLLDPKSLKQQTNADTNANSSSS